MKKCTNSACRRTFSPASPKYTGCCPYCGAKYPRIKYEITAVLLISYGTEKIKVVKIIRNALGIGLADAKHMVEEASREKPLRITKEMLKQGDIPSLLDDLDSVGALCKENQ